MKPLIDCVAFALIRDKKVLLEKRKLTKRVDPGKVCIPSGGIDKGETPLNAVLREIKEEFDVKAKNPVFIGSLIYETSDVDFNIFYFVIGEWQGEIKVLEADKLIWKNISEDYVDTWVDKLMMTAIKHRGLSHEKK